MSGKDWNDAKQEGRAPSTEGAEPVILGQEGRAPFSGPLSPKSPAELDADLDHWTMGARYGLAELDRDRNRELIGFAKLPPWPSWSLPYDSLLATGHGLGAALESYLGGGFGPGEIYVIGAAKAKAGKTAFLMQLAEGLALRSAAVALGAEGLARIGEGLSRPEQAVVEAVAGELGVYGPALTPVIVVSEMPADALTRRWLARWTGGNAGWFRAGKTALKGAKPDKADDINEAWKQAREAISSGLMAEARNDHMIWVPGAVAREGTGPGWKLGGYVERWRSRLQERYRREVVPVLVIDPVQRFQTPMENEVSALSAFAATIREWTTGENTGQGGPWVTLLTSDATKHTATGKAQAEGDDMATAVLRGSYHLAHELSGVFVLDRPGYSAINAARGESIGSARGELIGEGAELAKEAAGKCQAYSEALRQERVELMVTVAYNRHGRNTRDDCEDAPRFDWWPSRQRLYPVTEDEVKNRLKIKREFMREIETLLKEMDKARKKAKGNGKGEDKEEQPETESYV